MENSKFWLALAIWFVVLSGIAVCNWTYLLDKDEQLRNFGFLAAALMGAPLVIWRTMVLQRDVISKERDVEARESDVKLNSVNALSASYIQAMEHLGAMDPTSGPKVEIRLGAIYALEKIAMDNEDYRLQVFRVLEAYVNEQTRLLPEDGHTYQLNYKFSPRPDVNAVFEVLNLDRTCWISKTLEPHDYILRFDRCHLTGLLIRSMRYQYLFTHCNLLNATFSDSIFRPGSRFEVCNLVGANFDRTTAKWRNWNRSNFFDPAGLNPPASFFEADIRNSWRLTPEQLEGLDLRTTKRDRDLARDQPFPEGNEDDPY